MAEDTKKKDDLIDLDTLSDEDFLKLDEPSEVVETKENADANASGDADKIAADLAASTAGGGNTSENAEAGDGEGGQAGAGADGEGGGEKSGGETEAGGDLTDEEKAAAAAKDTTPDADEMKLAAQELEREKAEKKANDDKETLKLKDKDGKNIEPTKKEIEAADAADAQAVSDDFYKRVSASFKADGKDVQVRTPEEAIRLMQMGVNYSRRMKELKPLREMNAMLEAHGLNDTAKLNELIDLSKGSVQALNKYLKQHNIDPLDLDASKGDEHTTPNYQVDPVDVAFQEAIDITLQAEGGKELLSDINTDWDGPSKEALRNNPGIFGKLLEQRDTGVYSQIQKELLHQKTMGYLANVPYLEAYEQVGNAMQKAGVFNTADTSKKTGMAPIHSGSRKSAAKPKTEQTNPNLSSAPKSRNVASNDATSTELDYLSMDDDAFMKLAQPV